LVALLQVNAPGVAVAPFEGDSPRAVDGNGVALGLPMQFMQPPTGQVQVFQAMRLLERTEPRPAAPDQVRPHAAGVVMLEQRGQALMAKAANHGGGCSTSCDSLERAAIYRRRTTLSGVWPVTRLSTSRAPSVQRPTLLAVVDAVRPALGLSVTEMARSLRVSRATLHRLLACGIGVSPEMALRLGTLCGNGPGLWLRMQADYDLWQAEQALHDELALIETAPHDQAA